jgi:urocanate hydratase
VGVKDRYYLGEAFSDMVRSGEMKASIVSGRDQPDSGSVACSNQ